jgi:hypothetical protein
LRSAQAFSAQLSSPFLREGPAQPSYLIELAGPETNLILKAQLSLAEFYIDNAQLSSAQLKKFLSWSSLAHLSKIFKIYNSELSS